MNFPVGKVVSKGAMPLSLVDLLEQCDQKKFNGYVIVSVLGNFVEEGVLFFRVGEVYACCVECMSVKKLIKGDDAFNYFLKQSRGNGFFHLIELSRSQVDLVTAFDDKLLLVNKIPLKDIPKMIPDVYEPQFVEEVVESELDLDTYGLGELK
jgi:hypothetical protein